jgi:hypothetical protein
MNIAEMTKTFIAGAAITKRRIVKFGADAGHVIPAAAATDALIGISTDIDTAINDPCDVYVDDGIVYVDAGAAIVAGAFVTADTNGKAVASSVTGERIIGMAMTAAAADGDVIEVLLSHFGFAAHA